MPVISRAPPHETPGPPVGALGWPTMAVHHPEVGEFGTYLARIGHAVDDLLASDMTDALASDIDWHRSDGRARHNT